jgi:hypothetical protein
MRSALLEEIRWGIIGTQNVPVLRTLYRKTSQAVTWRIGRKLAQMPGVEAVFHRHNPPASLGFVVGHSDLDLTLIFNDEDAEDPRRIRTCSTELENLSRLYPLVQMRDARFMSQRELTQFPEKFSPLFELLYRPEDWSLLAGRDMRCSASRPFPPHRVPWHPEFNRWWEHLIQHYSLLNKSELKRGFMRTIYRCALKNQLAIQAAKGISVMKPDGFFDDELSSAEFDGNHDLRNILTDLKRQNYWEKHPEEVKTRILLLVLLAVGDFFNKWQAHPTIQKELEIHSRSAEEPHRSIYRELEGKIKSHPEIQPVLKSAVAYPLPHHYPYSYKVDLVLRDGLSPGEFIEGVRTIEHCFGGKEFTIGKYHAEITLTLESIYKHPLVFLGSPFPFLLEHIQEFGATVYGPPIATVGGTWNRDDLIDWCSIYFPYHLVTFRRRPEYRAAAMSFYQLASIRTFLEYGDKPTDALETRRMYLERFKKRDRDTSILDYFLQGTGDELNENMYHDVFVFLSNEYNQLESLLTEHNRTKT